MTRKVFFLLSLLSLAGCARNLAEQAVSSNEEARQAALRKLDEAKIPLRREVAPLLIERLSSENANVRRRAVQALSRLDLDALVPLIKALSSPSAKARAAAAEVLGQLGADAKSAAGTLVQAEQDKDPDVRLWAAVSLERIKATMSPTELQLFRVLYGSKEIAPPGALKSDLLPEEDPRRLLQQLRRADAKARAGAVLALVERGPLMVPALLNALTDPDEGVRDGAAEALRLITQDRADADQALVGFLKEGDPAARAAWDTTFALKGVDRASPASVPALASLAGQPPLVVRLEAIHALGAMGPDARSAVPALQAAAEDAHPVVRQAALRALRRIRPPAPGPSQNALAAKLAGAWSEMASRLSRGDIEGALSFFIPSRRDDLRAAFLALGDALPAVAKALDGPLGFRDAVGDRLVVLEGNVFIEGVQQTLQVEFIRDDKNDWKIRNF
jgi:HEAT repeat protein